MTSIGLDDFFIPEQDDAPQTGPTPFSEAPAPPPSQTPSMHATPSDSAASLADVGMRVSPEAGAVSPAPASQALPQPMSSPAPQGAPSPADGRAGMTATPSPSAGGAMPTASSTPGTAVVGSSGPPVAPKPAAPAPARPVVRTREDQLSAALKTFMRVSSDVEAAALVSLDGFIMASALPAGMHEDRVGAMSAAILGLGERAAIELGRGKLSQVFIEGDTGYVLLMAAGDRAVLTVLARLEAKLGLLLYDMRDVAEAIADILG